MTMVRVLKCAANGNGSWPAPSGASPRTARCAAATASVSTLSARHGARRGSGDAVGPWSVARAGRDGIEKGVIGRQARGR